jgi:hypothetical protein
MVVGTRLLSAADQQQKTSGQMLLLYFLGRIDGRAPKADLEALLSKQAASMTQADFSAAARRCGTELSTRGAEVERIGASLSKAR